MTKYSAIHRFQRIMAIDPGKTDGFATYGPEIVDNQVFQYTGTYDGFLQCILDFHPDIIVYEEFNHRQKDKVELVSAEHIGLIKWVAERRNILLFGQSPSYGKAFFDNAKLRKLKLYESGKPHGMDALRHLLQFEVKHGMFDMSLLK